MYYIKRQEQIQRAYVEPVNVKKVYRKDKGVCQICGLEVPFDTSSSNIWGATVDHIIPLSKGGKHSLSNCQLAHRMCNSIKSDIDDGFEIDWEVLLSRDEERWQAKLEELFFQLNREPHMLASRG